MSSARMSTTILVHVYYVPWYSAVYPMVRVRTNITLSQKLASTRVRTMVHVYHTNGMVRTRVPGTRVQYVQIQHYLKNNLKYKHRCNGDTSGRCPYTCTYVRTCIAIRTYHNGTMVWQYLARYGNMAIWHTGANQYQSYRRCVMTSHCAHPYGDVIEVLLWCCCARLCLLLLAWHTGVHGSTCAHTPVQGL
jgi:hypothetical protein